VKPSVARFLVRLYPRRWRERYDSELIALLEQTELTTSIAFDLLLGAIRERVREGSRVDLESTSALRELGRDFGVSLTATCLVYLSHWAFHSRFAPLASTLLTPGAFALVRSWMMLRVVIVASRRLWSAYRAAASGYASTAWEALRFTVGRWEFRVWILAMMITGTLDQAQQLQLLGVFSPILLLRFNSRAKLARNDQLIRLRHATRQRATPPQFPIGLLS